MSCSRNPYSTLWSSSKAGSTACASCAAYFVTRSECCPVPKSLASSALARADDRLLVGRLDEESLASLELEEAPQVLRVEEELLLGPLVRHQPERPLRQAAGELLDRLEELERAEGLADERVRARSVSLVVGRARVAGEEHDGHLGYGPQGPQPAAEGDAVDVRQRDVEHDHVWRLARQRAASPRRRCRPRAPRRR